MRYEHPTSRSPRDHLLRPTVYRASGGGREAAEVIAQAKEVL